MTDTLFVRAQDVADILNISKAKAYGIIKDLNNELEAMGYRTISGRVSTKYFMEQYYGMMDEEKKEVI